MAVLGRGQKRLVIVPQIAIYAEDSGQFLIFLHFRSFSFFFFLSFFLLSAA